MSNLQQNGSHNGHVFILARYHVCDELVKLHGLEFQGRNFIIEKAKTSPMIYRQQMTSKVCIKELPLLTTKMKITSSA